MARNLTGDDYRMLAEFRWLMRQFLAFSETAAGEVGLSPQQHQALLAIKGFDGEGRPTIGDLAERLFIRHNSAVGLVNRLSGMRLLKRRTDSTDKRKVTLSLTADADAVLAGLTAAHRDELRRLTPLLKPLLAKLER